MPSAHRKKTGARAATLGDVAIAAGVSASTASRALSGNTAISLETREAVEAAARQVGYRLRIQGARARKSATKIVGVVVGGLDNWFMPTLLEHLHNAFRESGYHITLIIDSMSESSSLQTLRPLIDGFLDGLIFATANLDSPVVAEIKKRGIPLVLVVRSVDESGVDTVVVDNKHAAVEAARHLYELGHRDIGMVMGPRNTSTTRDRSAGALAWLEENGIPRSDVPIIFGDYTTESGYSNTLSLLSQSKRLTAIIAGNDTIALGVLSAAKRSGIAVPERLSVISFDDIPLAGSPLVSLTTIRQPVAVMARTAARRLLELIRDRNFTPASMDVLPIQLIQRGTTGKAPLR
ncbi:LacI family DNA-binding transcriptional regulator [Lacisediminimonas sp.]|uniref:LacI family DNA-binding transcriptional regulator n=1 Tax=Lacisediminimonas sp. TaxID=3060582 RepID=UPI002723EF26|nr:LacI family DNA-binding transcriptional regulator [Lacisediminimonas sp.]MDO8298727.1 LacI family DNA-binding transcriptional regulator [Lacisediminimonas sp.]MDO9218781.1 LacI family DNA-binding transcriptional regulator [Lacisediminimonas sp.]